jgi:hypothetical protein
LLSRQLGRTKLGLEPIFKYKPSSLLPNNKFGAQLHNCPGQPINNKNKKIKKNQNSITMEK